MYYLRVGRAGWSDVTLVLRQFYVLDGGDTYQTAINVRAQKSWRDTHEDNTVSSNKQHVHLPFDVLGFADEYQSKDRTDVTDIDRSLALRSTLHWLYNHDSFLDGTHDQVHMTVIRLITQRQTRPRPIVAGTYVQNTGEFTVPPQFHEDALVQRETDEVERFLNPSGRSIHPSVM